MLMKLNSICTIKFHELGIHVCQFLSAHYVLFVESPSAWKDTEY